MVLTLGKFDGVHLGHRQLVARVLAEAAARGAGSAALVLYPNPVTVLTGRASPLLTSLDERLRRLTALGVEIVLPLGFDRALAELSPEAFIAQLAERWTLAAMVIGPDFAFGKNRSGDLPRLEAIGRANGFDVVLVPPAVVDGERVSSQRIRELIAKGEVERARRFLCASPRLTGFVVHGAKRGRELGFPTANLALTEDFVVPAHGIYTVRAAWAASGDAGDVATLDGHVLTPSDGSSSSTSTPAIPDAIVPDDPNVATPEAPSPWPPAACPACADGIASVGVRPTFDNGARIVEVFLLDFAADLYGRVMTVDFLRRQRPELRFDSIEGLVAQMNADVLEARANLAMEAGADDLAASAQAE